MTALRTSPEGHVSITPEGGAPAFGIILLHGVGASAAGMAPLVSHFAQAFPQSAVTALNGFDAFDMAPAGRQWFSVKGVTDESRPGRVRAVLPWMEALIGETAVAMGVNLDRLAFIGFSQGAIMALHLARLSAAQPAYIASLAGRLTVAADDPSPPSVSRLLLSHGTNDAVVPFACLEEARSLLTKAGHAVDTLPVPGGPHAIAPEQVRRIEVDLTAMFG